MCENFATWVGNHGIPVRGLKHFRLFCRPAARITKMVGNHGIPVRGLKHLLDRLDFHDRVRRGKPRNPRQGTETGTVNLTTIFATSRGKPRNPRQGTETHGPQAVKTTAANEWETTESPSGD